MSPYPTGYNAASADAIIDSVKKGDGFRQALQQCATQWRALIASCEQHHTTESRALADEAMEYLELFSVELLTQKVPHVHAHPHP